MKRMMIATALATTLGTAGFAATQAQMLEVDRFNSGIDTSGFTEQDYTIAYGIVTSGMSNGEKTAKLRALAKEDNLDTGIAMISEAEMIRLQQYAPEADFTLVTQAQAEAALAVSYSEDNNSVKQARISSILSGTEMDDATRASVTAGQMALLRGYAPGADLSGLSNEDLQIALAVAYSGMSNIEKQQQIEALVTN